MKPRSIIRSIRNVAAAIWAGITPGSETEQRLAADGGAAWAPAWWPGRRGGLECSRDGGGDKLRGLRVDRDVAAEQHAADDLPGVPGRILRVGGHVSPPWARGTIQRKNND